MREIRDKLVEVWRGLPEWLRRELRRSCRSGWVYSGMKEVGWSWSCGNGGMGFEEDLLKEGMEGEMIPSEPMDYMEYIRNLLGVEIKFRSEKRGEVIWIGVDVGEWIWGYGRDREEAFLRLVGEVGEWYWVERCPGLGDIRRGSIVDVDSGADLNCEIEICEVGGEIEVTFMDFYTARMFIGKWERFVLDSSFVNNLVESRFYHGKMRMMEGDILIYSMPAKNNYVATAYGVGASMGSSMGNIQISAPNYNIGGYIGMSDNDLWHSKEYKDLVDMIRDKNYSGYKN